MTFFETPRFPETFSTGAEGGPGYITDVVEMRSGVEQRNQTQSSPRQHYSVSFVNRDEDEFGDLYAFFRAIGKGRAHGFRFKDKLDFTVSTSEGILALIAGSPSNTYQMYKRYTSGSQTDDRKIIKPVSGTVTIYEAGLPMGSGASVDFNSGIVTLGGIGSPAGPFTWAGQFDVPVRLDTDLMKPGFIPISGTEKLGTWDGVELVELKFS